MGMIRFLGVTILTGYRMIHLITLALLMVIGLTEPALAQAEGSKVRVLLVIDDSHRNSVPRKSDLSIRTISKLSSVLREKGVEIADGKLLGELPAQTSMADVMKRYVEINDKSVPDYLPRVLVTFEIVAFTNKSGASAKGIVRLTSNIFDMDERMFIGDVESPQSEFEIDPDNAIKAIGDYLVGLTEAYGNDLSSKLNDVLGGRGLSNNYSVIFKNFSTQEYNTTTETMQTEFPGYVKSLLLNSSPTNKEYSYRSFAPTSKLLIWMNILMTDIGLIPDKKVKITMQGKSLTLEKINGISP